MRRRALASAVLVVLLMAAVYASGVVQRELGREGVASQLLQDLASPQDDPAQWLQGLIQGQEGASDSADEGAREGALERIAPLFAREGFVPKEADDLQVGGEGRVIGLCLPGTAAEGFSSMSKGLEEAGWTVVPSGQDACGTFVKDEGDLRWLLVSCLQAGGQVSVVVQCAADVRKEE